MASDATVRLRAGDHFVHFYEHDDDLAARVVEYVRRALLAGDAAIIIATREHRAQFTAGLAQAGADLDAARASGSLIELDAADRLARFAGGGSLDAPLFERAVGTFVRAAADSGRRVCAYGEMVALLWKAGDVGRALELEGLWNELRERVPFTLFCAYPSWLTHSDDGASVFSEVCAAHSHVLGAAPSADSADATRRFPRSASAPAEARRFVGEWVAALGHSHLVENAQLAVSELATNAVAHARSDFTVSVDRTADAIRIIVGDASTDAPVQRRAGPASPRGRGLPIVAAITSAMGHEVVDGGKLVWADMAIAR